MIAIHFFPKNMKIPIVLPYQSLNLTYNIIRSNLSTTSDSSSSSNSDSDSNNSKSSTKKYKNVGYLKPAKASRRKKEIEMELIVAARKLIITSEKQDKEKILSELLTNIKDIQNKIEIETQGKSVQQNHYKRDIKNIDKTKHIKNIDKTKHIKTIDKIKYTKNIDKTKYKKDDPPMIRMQQDQIITSYNNHKSGTQVDMSQKQQRIKNTFLKPSIIKTLYEQHKGEDILPSKFEQKYKSERKKWHATPLKNVQKEVKLIDSALQTDYSVKELLTKWQLMNAEKTSTKRYKVHMRVNRIFDQELSDTSDVPELKIWNLCEEKELKSMVTCYPKNAFEEMIEWTNQGKLWKFPIDNEQGMEMEQNVHFSKHVFLERYLSPWCSAKGPIRHFMELVCVGLSKNPYMTFDEKYNHIMWYKDYFNVKQDLLQKLGL